MEKHYNGQYFQNIYPKLPERTLKQLLKWFSTRKPSKWPTSSTATSKTIPFERVSEGKISITFINHSSVLIQMDGVNILTDPIWSKRCSPFKWAGPKRVAPPGIPFENLPKIDIVLVSHNHYDHMDIPTLKKLQKNHHPIFFVALGNRKLLEKKGLKKVVELDWWQEHKFAEQLKITFVPAQHFARRGLFDYNKTLWGGFVLEGITDRIYFAGDTGYGTHFIDLKKKFGKFTLSLLPIGAYKPQWFMSSVHMSPEDAVKAHIDLESNQSIGIHFGTFQLSDEALDEPIKDLQNSLRSYKIPLSKFCTLSNGETFNLGIE
jgi:L-ascorbate metabolism protein UlaG (beta-lactamase superfamily)